MTSRLRLHSRLHRRQSNVTARRTIHGVALARTAAGWVAHIEARTYLFRQVGRTWVAMYADACASGVACTARSLTRTVARAMLLKATSAKPMHSPVIAPRLRK